MEIKILQKATASGVWVVDNTDKINELDILTADERKYVTDVFAAEKSVASINKYNGFAFVVLLRNKKTDWQTAESLRKTGAELASLANQLKLTEICINNLTQTANAALLLAEGAALASYQFLKYRTEAKKLTNTLQRILIAKNSATLRDVNQLQITVNAIERARNLVNEPPNVLTAEKLAEEIDAMGKEAGFKVTILNKARIAKEKMGGLMAVNMGSPLPPTFTIMEHKPARAINKKPIVLVGKGIVYDTGGLSLKPTPNSMDRMKSDMSGAAVVCAAMYAVALMKLPLHIIALVPATDNRPGENAYTPGDVITMYSGATVEVLNTDAEGRMVLADALHWAKRYKPELVADFATLTGAASMAVGEHGIVCMGNADENVVKAFRESGYRQYERLVEYPMWDEYGEQIKSEVADIKNVGGPTGGAITAGKFLEHFTDYPWMHFDIAGVSFATGRKGYIPSGGTGYGIRMLVDFLTHYGK